MKRLLSITAFAMCFNLSAQQTENTAFHAYNVLFYNPAYAGVRNTFNVTGISRWQYVKTDGRPASQFLSLNLPIAKRRLGIGAHFNRDVIGVREKTLAKIDFSSSTKIGSKLRFNVGLSPGVSSYGADFSQLVKVDINDPVANSSYSVTMFDFGAGMYLHSEKGYIGLSMPNVIRPSNQLYLPVNHVFLTMGRVMKVHPLIHLKPFGLVKYAVGAPLVVDLNLSAFYNEDFWLSAMIRPGDAWGFSVNHTASKRYTVGYSFERTYTFGRSLNTHEFMLMWDMRKDKDLKINSPRYF